MVKYGEQPYHAGQSTFAPQLCILTFATSPWHLARHYVGIWFCSKIFDCFCSSCSCPLLPYTHPQKLISYCMAPIALFQINFQPHLHGLPAYLSPKALIPLQNIHLYSKKKMGLINMLFIVIALQVLFLMCMPAHEARRILYAENKNE